MWWLPLRNAAHLQPCRRLQQPSPRPCNRWTMYRRATAPVAIQTWRMITSTGRRPSSRRPLNYYGPPLAARFQLTFHTPWFTHLCMLLPSAFFISCYDLSSFTSKQVKGRIETLRFPWDVVIKFDASLRRSVNAFTQTCIYILTARRNLVICLWKKFSDLLVKEI